MKQNRRKRFVAILLQTTWKPDEAKTLRPVYEMCFLMWVKDGIEQNMQLNNGWRIEHFSPNSFSGFTMTGKGM